MGRREFSSEKNLKVDVEAGQLVTLELTVKLTFALPAPISAEHEMANAIRLMGSDLRHRVADELEQTWLGVEAPPMPGAPEQGAPILDIDEVCAPSPESEIKDRPSTEPPPFNLTRRNSQQARTRQQQIVLHLEGRYSFKPDRRADRLAFTAWLTEVPGLTLTSTNDLTPDLAAKVLARLNREPDAAHLIAEWHTYGLGRPITSSSEKSLGS
ncbi:hypothetical protein [Deinococcus sp. UYEF24]